MSVISASIMQLRQRAGRTWAAMIPGKLESNYGAMYNKLEANDCQPRGHYLGRSSGSETDLYVVDQQGTVCSALPVICTVVELIRRDQSMCSPVHLRNNNINPLLECVTGCSVSALTSCAAGVNIYSSVILVVS